MSANTKIATGRVTLKTLTEEKAKRVQKKLAGRPLPEHKSALLAFGDGDGTFWDRWLSSPQPTVSSFKSGYKEPKLGFKMRTRAKNTAKKEKRWKGKAGPPNLETSASAPHILSVQNDSSCSDNDDSEWESFSESEFEAEDADAKTRLPPLDVEKISQRNGRKGKQSRVAVDILSARSKKYIGPVARRRFFKKFQREWRSQNKVLVKTSNHSTASLIPERQPNLLPVRLTNLGSAREKFLQRCAYDQLPPQPAIIRRFKSSELSLSGLSLGDRLGGAVAEALPNVPDLEELDLSNNRLTGISVSRTVDALRLSSLDVLISINLSGNNLGPKGFSALLSFLSETHVLSSLELEKTRAGDREAELLCDGLMKNSTLTELNVSNNLFAEAAGHSFARMLRRKKSILDDRELTRLVPAGDGTMKEETYVEPPSVCRVTNLDLSWNQIRKSGAAAVGRSLLFNDTLNTLDLSYCAFGDTGTMVVMDSLRTNTTLTWLELDNNAIKGKGAMVIASSLEKNTTLKYLQLWENPLGKAGGRALLRSVSRTGAIRSIALDKCNFEIEEDGIFDPEYPPSKLELDLDDLYQRSVAEEVVRILETKPNMQVKRFLLDGIPVSYEQREPEDLPGYTSDQDLDAGDLETDTDSGSDSDAESSQEGRSKMKKSQIDPYDTSHLLFRLTNECQFEVPDTGHFLLECDVKPRRAPKRSVKVSREGLKGMLSIIFGGEPSSSRKDRMLRLRNAMYDAHITARQGKKILKQIKSKEERIEAMEFLLPKLLDPENKFQLLSQCLEDKDIKALASQMGENLQFTPNNPTGHYELNLEEQNDRELAKYIFQIDVENMRWAEGKSGRGDTSQNQLGDFSGFRNAIFRGKPVILDPSGKWWNNGKEGALLPSDGFLVFDYVHAKTPKRSMRRLRPTAAEFEKWCKTLGLYPGCTFEEETSFEISSESIIMRLLDRTKSVKSMKPGRERRHFASTVLQNWWRGLKRTPKVNGKVINIVEKLDEDSGATRLQRWYKKLRVKWGFEEGLNPSRIMDSTAGGIVGLVRRALKRQAIIDQAKAKCVRQNGLLPLRRAVSRMYLTCKQVAHVMSCFPHDQPKYARVRVLQACFSRIVDLENLFPHIMSKPGLLYRKILTKDKDYRRQPTSAPRDDYEEAIHCLGWLNIFNPRDPDWTYNLDHSQPDHYALSRMLIKLADVEPGENFVEETWTKFDKQAIDANTGEKGCFIKVPGWQLPESWLDPEKIPNVGFLHFQYYSGRDPAKGSDTDPRGPLSGLEGCDPVWELRQDLMANVLIGNSL